MDIDIIKSRLQIVLSSERYKHSLRVLNTSTELAKIYGADVNLVQVAALLHDYAKELPIKELETICSTYFEDEIDSYPFFNQILHSFAASYLVKKEFEIDNLDILNAIKYHTTGRAKMSLIEKIVYIADAIEPKREYPLVNEIRDLAYIDIDESILLEVNTKIKYLIKKDLPIHKNSIAMRNFLLSQKNRKRR